MLRLRSCRIRIIVYVDILLCRLTVLRLLVLYRLLVLCRLLILHRLLILRRLLIHWLLILHRLAIHRLPVLSRLLIRHRLLIWRRLLIGSRATMLLLRRHRLRLTLIPLNGSLILILLPRLSGRLRLLRRFAIRLLRLRGLLMQDLSSSIHRFGRILRIGCSGGFKCRGKRLFLCYVLLYDVLLINGSRFELGGCIIGNTVVGLYRRRISLRRIRRIRF